MSTPNPVAPVALTPAQVVNNQLISMLLNQQEQLLSTINYLESAATNLATAQAQLTAVQAQLTALGYVAPTGS